MNENRCTEDMKMWLLDLTYSRLSDDEVLKGFVKYYVLYNLSISRVFDDLHFRTYYPADRIAVALDHLKKVLYVYAGVSDDLSDLSVDEKGE